MKRILVVLLGCCLAGSLHAGTISFTGAELFTKPDVSFPTTTPVVSGTSLQFGPGAAAHEKLLVLPILPSGTGPITVIVSMNLTRLPCVSDCAGGDADHDPLVTLGDGSNLIGIQFSDNGDAFADLLMDQGTTGNRTQHASIGPINQPAIGESFDVEVEFVLDESYTGLHCRFRWSLCGYGEETTYPLNNDQAINFVFMRNNDLGEQYQINTLSISGPHIEPSYPLFLTLSTGVYRMSIERLTVGEAVEQGLVPTLNCPVSEDCQKVFDAINRDLGPGDVGCNGCESIYWITRGPFYDPEEYRIQQLGWWTENPLDYPWFWGWNDIDGFLVLPDVLANIVTLRLVPGSLEIDIKPNADEANPIAPNARGLIPVAILTTDDFDALTVDPTTLAFGPGGAGIAHRVSHAEDVDGDGDIDLMVHFRTQVTGIACGDTEATLTGVLFDGQPVEGSDAIKTVGRGCN